LKTWLTTHIMGKDQDYQPFMEAHPEAVAEAVDRHAEEMIREIRAGDEGDSFPSSSGKAPDAR